MRTLLLFCILVALPILSWGQENLVPNGGFEEITECPWAASLIELAVPWYNDVGGVELYHTCNSESMGVPANTTGNQYPHSGEAYAGIYTYGGANETNGREYLRVELTELIQASVRYRVSFYASLADKFDYAVGSLGAHFSDTLITRTSFNSLPGVEPTIQSPAGQIFSDKDLWYLIADTFTSRVGGERYLAIGNFKSTAESDTLFVPTGDHNRLKSYYYIDDVSVIALDSIPEGIADAQALQFAIHPNPSTGPFTLTWQSTTAAAYAFTLYDAQGREAYAHGGHTISGTTTVQLQLAHLPAGIYFGRLAADDGIRHFKWIRE